MTTTTQLRSWWAPACEGPFARVELYGNGVAAVRTAIVDAVHALSACMEHHHYKSRAADTGGYNCRKITGGSGYSLHAYGIAIDINWTTNPYGSVLVTDMPAAMVAAIKAIRTRNGKQVWRWGGNYAGNKDAMHFEVTCHPADLATGIDPASLPQPEPAPEPPEDDDMRKIVKGDASPKWYITDGITKRHVDDREEAGALVFSGFAQWNNGQPFALPQAVLDDITTV